MRTVVINCRYKLGDFKRQMYCLSSGGYKRSSVNEVAAFWRLWKICHASFPGFGGLPAIFVILWLVVSPWSHSILPVCMFVSKFPLFIRTSEGNGTPFQYPCLEPHGRKSLEGCRPWGCWGSDMTEQLNFHFSLPCIEERNGNPLQCSCLENPRDMEAWWAAVDGVAQNRTWLKWLSSSSCSSMKWSEFAQSCPTLWPHGL